MQRLNEARRPQRPSARVPQNGTRIEIPTWWENDRFGVKPGLAAPSSRASAYPLKAAAEPTTVRFARLKPAKCANGPNSGLVPIAVLPLAHALLPTNVVENMLAEFTRTSELLLRESCVETSKWKISDIDPADATGCCRQRNHTPGVAAVDINPADRPFGDRQGPSPTTVGS